MTASALAPDRRHRRRLREIWRSAGWPCRDDIEVELLLAGWVQRVWDPAGRETLRVTELGLQALAATRAGNRAALDAHEDLVETVARAQQREGRLAWRGLSLRAGLPGEDRQSTRWVMVRPDLYSVRHTSVASYLQPLVHEIKVRRADLLADLRRPDKGAAYRELAGRCCYVLKAGIAEPEEVPACYGVMLAHADGRLESVRSAPGEPTAPSFALWMALARATPLTPPEDDAQMQL